MYQQLCEVLCSKADTFVGPAYSQNVNISLCRRTNELEFESVTPSLWENCIQGALTSVICEIEEDESAPSKFDAELVAKGTKSTESMVYHFRSRIVENIFFVPVKSFSPVVNRSNPHSGEEMV